MSFIDTKNLSFTYTDEENPLPVLHGVTLSFQKGEFVAILGRNGSGKSTFAKLLNLVLEASSGAIIIDGKSVHSELTEEEIIDLRKRVGMVFQNPDNQLVATIVEEDVAFGPENLGIPSDEIRRRVDEALALVDMSEYALHAPHKLSGGQKQRIAIAGVIAMLPDCILFDESTAMLDPRGRAEVMDTLIRLNREKGITTLLITHNMDEAVRADRVVVIDNGRVVMDGTPRQVFAHTQEIFALGLAVPQATELATALGIGGSPLTPLEGADAVEQWLNQP